jgi:hypothetical protein
MLSLSLRWEDHGLGGCQEISSPNAVEHPATTVRGTRSGLLRLRADDATGASGGPWYFIDGTQPRIIAVHAFARDGVSGTGFVGGPRVTEFRNAAIVVMKN